MHFCISPCVEGILLLLTLLHLNITTPIFVSVSLSVSTYLPASALVFPSRSRAEDKWHSEGWWESHSLPFTRCWALGICSLPAGQCKNPTGTGAVWYKVILSCFMYIQTQTLRDQCNEMWQFFKSYPRGQSSIPPFPYVLPSLPSGSRTFSWRTLPAVKPCWSASSSSPVAWGSMGSVTPCAPWANNGCRRSRTSFTLTWTSSKSSDWWAV